MTTQRPDRRPGDDLIIGVDYFDIEAPTIGEALEKAYYLAQFQIRSIVLTSQWSRTMVEHR